MALSIDLTGKVALVTGASRGIGRAIAQHMHQAGAYVALQYGQNTAAAQSLLQELQNQEQAGQPRSALFKANLEKVDQVQALVQQVVQACGGLHVLVNNAGVAVSAKVEGPEEAWLAAWQKNMRINLDAVGLLCLQAVKHFRAQQAGTIINISSRAAFRGDTPEYMAYAASKGGVVALTRSLARAYGKEGIVAFNVAPGFVRTDMAQDFFDQYGEALALNDIALPQLTQPNDIGPMVAFLASGMANHATGATIDVNAASYVH